LFEVILSRKIRSDTENKVIQNFLNGMTREQNAADCWISPASVSNIVSDWLESMSGHDREIILEFVKQVRKEKSSVKECAIGFRIHNIMKSLDISDDDENFQIILKDVYELYRLLAICCTYPHRLQFHLPT